MEKDIFRLPPSAVEAGQRRAAALGRPVLVSHTRPIADPGDAISLFAGASRRGIYRILWSQPSQDLWIVGLGAAFVLQCQGNQRFAKAKESWKELTTNALVEAPPITGVGPIAFGGFCFDPAAPKGPEWRDHGDCLLVLPGLIYTRSQQGFWVTENILVQPNGKDPGPTPGISSNIEVAPGPETIWEDGRGEWGG